MPDFFADLSQPPAVVGGKAGSLARLRALGFETPAGFVVTDALFRCLLGGDVRLPSRLDRSGCAELEALAAIVTSAAAPPGFSGALADRLQTTGGTRFSVRSSFREEAGAAANAPGVYESRIDVPMPGVEHAIRRVLASVLAPGAVAYARNRALDPLGAPIAVLIHPFVAGDANGHAACVRDPAGNPLVSSWVGHGRLSQAARNGLHEILSAIPRAEDPVEFEWVVTGSHLVFLQCRPFVQAPAPPGFAGSGELPATEDPAHWQWDAVHNPIPLSPAQQGLVSLVDDRCRIGVRQKVLGGYLFFRPDPESAPTAIAPTELPAFFAALAADVEQTRLALAAPDDPDPGAGLEAALSLFTRVYQPLVGTVGAAVRRARDELTAFVQSEVPDLAAAVPELLIGTESAAALRARILRGCRSPDERQRAQALADFLSRFGDEARTWDVAAPTFREDPPRLSSNPASEPSDPIRTQAPSAAADRIAGHLTDAGRARFAQILTDARRATVIAEDDDWLYARIQAAVRRALLMVGDTLSQQGVIDRADDVFFLPLAMVRAWAGGTRVTGDPRAMIATARTAWRAAHAAPPPLGASAEEDGVAGHGIGGRVIGYVHIHGAGIGGVSPSATAPDRILVARTLLPTELPLLSAAALVTETGGPLDHVAAQARERGLPAVVGARGALARFSQGDLVLVDGVAGRVRRLSRGIVPR